MLYIIVRLVLAGIITAAAAAFIAAYKRAGKSIFGFSARRVKLSAVSVAAFFALTAIFYFIPAENLLISFDSPESAFSYNNANDILEVVEYDSCALIISATNDGEITTHVLSNDGSGWKLETMYNSYSDSATLNHCVVQRLYSSDRSSCFVIVDHSPSGSSAESPTKVTDNSGTTFVAATYLDSMTFYYGFVEEVPDEYVIYVDGEKIKFD